MRLHKLQLLSAKKPESVQAKKLVSKIKQLNCGVMVDGAMFSGFVMPDGYVLSANIVGKTLIFFGELEKPAVYCFEHKTLAFRMTDHKPKVQLPPVSYTKRGQYLFAFMGEHLLVFQRQKGSASREQMSKADIEVWAGTPIFTRFGMLSSIMMGKNGSDYYCVNPHTAIEKFGEWKENR